MNGTLRSWMHYIELRSGNGTQKEHQEVAIECGKVLSTIFPIMEEFNLCKYLSRLGKLSLAHASVLTSARKFREEGTLITYWRMAYCLTRYTLSASPQRSREIYYPRNAQL